MGEEDVFLRPHDLSVGAATPSCRQIFAANRLSIFGMTGHRAARAGLRMHVDGMPAALTLQPTAIALKVLE